MARRVPSYFVTDKWNYAPAARRKAIKLLATIQHAKDHLFQTHDPADICCDDPAFRQAWELLNGASKAVAAWEDAQQAAAKARELAQK